ncbi:MAG: HK97 family phage prohead protease, partial [Clostridia bacterium]|nr:HK97 family phage prohead protease [Clostridia bacterium]
MSNIELRAINNGIKITGIVHKIGTASKMLRRKGGQFIEKFSKEAWEEAITENNEIRLLVNHDTKQSYATTKNGTLSLWIEDNDVKMDAIIYDKELAEEIRAYGDGFSFGFTQKEEKWEDADDYSIRSITKALISEVSVLINSRPAYGGTLVEVRSAENGPDYI